MKTISMLELKNFFINFVKKDIKNGVKGRTQYSIHSDDGDYIIQAIDEEKIPQSDIFYKKKGFYLLKEEIIKIDDLEFKRIILKNKKNKMYSSYGGLISNYLQADNEVVIYEINF
jgi:hypothetical protein